MPIKVLVRDRDGKPVSNVTVTIKWKDGISKVDADSSGSADTAIDGYVVYTQVYDDLCHHEVYTKDVKYLTHRMR
ncbi:MAG: hypothetical protein U0X20_02255 [Caldilineaceae bacterium]